MTDIGRIDIEQGLAQAAIEYGRRLRRSQTWLYVDNPEAELPDHGWKLHISARATEYERLAVIVVPVLLAAGCNFKMARSTRVLGSLNEGRKAAASVGKAWTVYPDSGQVRQLGIQLAELLSGEQAPRVLSDRRVADDAPVYYRYGPFRRQLVAGVDGQLNMRMTGPDGESFEGLAKSTYRQPPWTRDPFRATAADTSGDNLVELLGGHYRPLQGLLQAGHGNVYRGEDIRTGEPIVVKQARAYVAETTSGDDARMRLRNERYVLERLTGIDGIPTFIDHFRHGADEYLVTSFDGEFNLAEDVPRNGRYRPQAQSDSTGRTLDRLGARLARILVDIHARGFVVADLSPKNIVIEQSTGEPTFIDFGLCTNGTVHISGGTPGYSSHTQLTGMPATAADDMRALGMTLLFAATGANPVTTGSDPDTPRIRALQTIRGIYGAEQYPSIRCVIGLLDTDADRALAALHALSAGHPERFTDTTLSSVVTPIARPDAAALADQLLDDLIARAVEQLDRPDGWPEVNAYRGVAGVGLELLHHLHRPDVVDLVQRLAQFAASGARRTRLAPGLLVGSTGIEILLRRVRAVGLDTPTLPPDLVLPSAGWQPYGDDLVVGAAGVGFGHCLLAELSSSVPHDRQLHLDTAERCADLLFDHTDAVSHHPAEDLPTAAGLDAAAGLAHGQAGVITFLLALTCGGIIDADHAALRTRIDAFYRQTRSLIDRSGHSTAVPLCVSWCRGLAGIGDTLLRIAVTRDDAHAMDLAVAAGNACATWIPYLSHRGACCGISGVGSFLVSLAETSHDDRFTEAAWSAADQLILRGVADGPGLDPAQQLADQPNIVSWSSGHAGTLGFLRRLHTVGAAPTVGPF
ncbi:lanthionine synthetase LanC family protein [Nocardia sp. NPDC046473]|uniref:class III lanthionine synthetase LanKC N-terminal domain-containing protein n=1 Tax=Nocardia sp. NPDC046473 TaxID=3155733 RepID=UPI0033FCCFF2